MSSRARAASALPRVAFITPPTSAPAAAILPSRTLSADVGVRRDAPGRRSRDSSPSSLTTLQAAALDHLVRRALPGQHALEHLAGQLVVERAGGDQLGDPGDLRGRDRQVGERDAGLVGPAGQLAHPPLARVGGRRARRDRRLDQVDRAGVVHGVPCPGRTRPTRPAAGRAGPTGSSGSAARSSSTHSAVRRDRHQVGLGEVAVVLRLLLGPARGGGAGVLVEVPGLLDDPAAGVEHRRPAARSRSAPPAPPSAAS